MKTLLHSENFIRNSFTSNDVTINLSCDLFLLLFKAMDAVEKTSHSRAIYYLYQQRNQKLTKQGVANEVCSNVKTLKRDREKYSAYFFYFYHYVKSLKLTAESAITSLH